eukprot:125449_1
MQTHPFHLCNPGHNGHAEIVAIATLLHILVVALTRIYHYVRYAVLAKKESIILMLRNQATFLMINDEKSVAKMKRYKTLFFMQITRINESSFTVDISTDNISNYNQTFFIKEIDDEIAVANKTITTQITKTEIKLKEIETLEQKEKDGEILDAEQMAKISRKEYLSHKLERLKQKLSLDVQQSSPKVETLIQLQKGAKSTTIDINIDEKHDPLYHLGLYGYKTAKQPLKNSNQIKVLISKNKNERESFKPKPIELSSIFKRKDDVNDMVHFYWSLPPQPIYGDVSYSVIINNPNYIQDYSDKKEPNNNNLDNLDNLDIIRLIPMDKLLTQNNIQIDDRVRLQNGRTGVIRWKGNMP